MQNDSSSSSEQYVAAGSEQSPEVTRRHRSNLLDSLEEKTEVDIINIGWVHVSIRKKINTF